MANKVYSKDEKLTCGIIMPVSECSGYTKEHWSNVLNIIKSAITKTNKFDAVPVWENYKADIIHDTIINNLLKSDIIICDISTTNPNVMYELGLRMTIKKPVVIIKDDSTKVPFDTNVIRYISYPKDLHYFKIEEFIDNLCSNIINTWSDYSNAPEEYTQLINLQDFKKYKITTSLGESENLTAEEAFEYLCQLIRTKNTSINDKDLHSTDLRSAIWEIRGDSDNFFQYINDFASRTRNALQELKTTTQVIDEDIDVLLEKTAVFSNAIDTFIKTVEGTKNG